MTAMEITERAAVLIEAVSICDRTGLAGQSAKPLSRARRPDSISQIKAGESIHVALAQQKSFRRIVVSMAQRAREPEKLDEVMFKVPTSITQVQSSLRNCFTVEPIMIMFIGGHRFSGLHQYTTRYSQWSEY